MTVMTMVMYQKVPPYAKDLENNELTAQVIPDRAHE